MAPRVLGVAPPAPGGPVGPAEDVLPLRQRLPCGGTIGNLDRPPTPVDRLERAPLLLLDHRVAGEQVRALTIRCLVLEPLNETKAARNPTEGLGVAAESPPDQSLLEQQG